MLTISFPGMPLELKAIEMVPVSSGDRLFLMDRNEITQAQFLSLMGQNPSQFQLGPDYPTEGVSWESAQQLCTNLPPSFAMPQPME
jgi:formylglycine-generating enzyme required for sulfatase activity